MKVLQLSLCVLSACFLFSGAADANSHLQITSLLADETHGEVRSMEDIYGAGKKFKCPHAFGTYHDPDDCSYYYVCMSGIPIHNKCRSFMQFDYIRKRCLPSFIAICGNDQDKSTTTTTPSGSKGTTPPGDSFTCPSFMGSYPHQEDCSKYYSCVLYIPSLKTCPATQLFDAVKSACKPADKVNCGTRQRPGSTTTSIITETEPSSTPTETISTETEIDITTTTEVSTETPTTTVITTTEDFPTGPPPTDCDEDDVDCIIDETGDITKWFRCPQDIGAYVHPSSDKLFIFCMNWIPSVKKCGMNMVFSEELATCVEVTDSE